MTFVFSIVIQTEEIESDDSLKVFMKKPMGLTPEAVLKSRQSDLALAPSSSPFPMRKKSMTAHSSVIAIMNKSSLKTVASKPQGDPEINEETSSTPVRNVDKTNGVRKIVGELEKNN